MKIEGLERHVVDAIEAPEHYYSHAEFEDAGDGNVRVIRYVKRRGILIPVVNTVSSAASLAELGKRAVEYAQTIMGGGIFS